MARQFLAPAVPPTAQRARERARVHGHVAAQVERAREVARAHAAPQPAVRAGVGGDGARAHAVPAERELRGERAAAARAREVAVVKTHVVGERQLRTAEKKNFILTFVTSIYIL